MEVAARGLEKREGSQNVGFDKYIRAGDRPVDMTFGGEMDHGIRLILGKDRRHRAAVANVVFLECVMRTGGNRRKRRQIPRIRHLVDDNDIIFQVGDEMTAYCRSNKAAP